MNTVTVACLSCGCLTMTNAAEKRGKVLCDVCIAPTPVQAPPADPTNPTNPTNSRDVKDITPKAVLRALAKRPGLLDGVVKLTCPTDMAGCVELLLAVLSKETLSAFQQSEKADLIAHHHGVGTYIRNFLRLWSRSTLVKTLCATQEENHPDAASMAIMEALWVHVQDMSFE